jgi:hypothetical protein
MEPITKIRKSYEIRDKRCTVQHVNELVAHRCSRRKACGIVGIPGIYYRRWKKLVAKVDDMNSAAEFTSQNTTGGAREFHSGRNSFLSKIKLELKRFIFQLPEQGIQIINWIVLREAACILHAFKEKSTRAKELAVHRFTRSVGLTQHQATHTAQKHFSETEADTQDFIAMMKEKVAGRNPNDILVMDQTPIPFSYHSNKT